MTVGSGGIQQGGPLDWLDDSLELDDKEELSAPEELELSELSAPSEVELSESSELRELFEDNELSELPETLLALSLDPLLWLLSDEILLNDPDSGGQTMAISVKMRVVPEGPGGVSAE